MQRQAITTTKQKQTKKKYKKNIARPKWNRGMHKGRLN